VFLARLRKTECRVAQNSQFRKKKEPPRLGLKREGGKQKQERGGRRSTPLATLGAKVSVGTKKKTRQKKKKGKTSLEIPSLLSKKTSRRKKGGEKRSKPRGVKVLLAYQSRKANSEL